MKTIGNVSENKIDTLEVLLSVIEGIKNFPNLIFVAFTNRLDSMN